MTKPQPRNWDINGWCVDCLPPTNKPWPVRCPDCAFVATAVTRAHAEAAWAEHHNTIHLPSAAFVAHTARHP